MDSFDLAKLAQTTIDLSDELPSHNPFDSAENYNNTMARIEQNFLQLENNEIVDDRNQIPNGPGLVYRLDKRIGTFCVRGLPTNSIYQTYLKLSFEDKKVIKKLRIETDNDFESISYFETETVRQARAIEQNMLNKRFPYMEDMVCNISDPGFSWWMNAKKSGVHIFFTSHGVQREDQFLKLGPLGGPQKAIEIFKKFYDFLNHVSTLARFSCDEKTLLLESNTQDNLIEGIRNVFIAGEYNLEGIESQYGKDYMQFFDYLRSLSFSRTFWIDIQELVSDSIHRFKTK
ncbi:MAG: hypothetical protein H6622_16750 [Halobacteriovoraceae bacterium]|nr:hypothetical protein [Halobacteriovoraceae bacterium]